MKDLYNYLHILVFNIISFTAYGQNYVEWAPFEKVRKKEVWVDFWDQSIPTGKLSETNYDSAGFIKEFKLFNLPDSSILYHSIFENVYTHIDSCTIEVISKEKALIPYLTQKNIDLKVFSDNDTIDYNSGRLCSLSDSLGLFVTGTTLCCLTPLQIKPSAPARIARVI